MRIRVTLQENPCETIAFHVGTPAGNVHSCRKLFSMLNIERRWYSKSDRKVEELAYANGQGRNFAKLIAVMCAGH